jgi:two-component system, cell cycle sensor histidine kinase and response regulator CckA
MTVDDRLFQQILEALRQSEARYRHLIEHATDIIYTHTLDGRLITVNRVAEIVLGYSREEFISKSIFELIAAEHQQMARRMIEEKLQTPSLTSTTYTIDVLTKTGEHIPLEISTQIIYDQGAPLAVQGIARDVTERKKAEQALRRSEERFRKVIETSGEGIAMRDPSGHLTFVNGRFAEMLGFSVPELVGKHVRDIIAPEFHQLVQESFVRRKNTGISETIDIQFVRKNGEYMDAILAASPMYDEEGSFIGSLGMVTDITERKVLEAQLRQSQKMEAVGRLAGGVAHDFNNNLLTAIRGHVDMLSSEMEGDSPLLADVVEIGKAADRAAALTQQLLAFSRRQMLQPVVMQIDSVVREMETLLRRLIAEDIDLQITLGAEGKRVRADRTQIEQVLMNLLVNAVDAMPSGGTVRIVTGPAVVDEEFARANPGAHIGDHVSLCVTDTGHGMDSQTLSHVFEPFFTTKDIGKGTGLGLATVYGIVKQSGGHIRVLSEVGRGTTFEILLPSVQDPVVAPREGERTLPRTDSGETVLVAEDEDAVRALTVRILRKRGYQVLEARDGRNAIEVAEQFAGSIRLLVTDVIMPRMGGRELSESLARVRPEMKVLFMSGYTDDQLLQRGVLQNGSGNFLEKPFTPEALANKVREVLESQ